jgi:hypothetical protein
LISKNITLEPESPTGGIQFETNDRDGRVFVLAGIKMKTNNTGEGTFLTPGIEIGVNDGSGGVS